MIATNKRLPATVFCAVMFVTSHAYAFPPADHVAVCLGYGVQNSDSCVNQPPESPNPNTGRCDEGDDYYSVNSTFHPYWKARGVYYELFDWDSGNFDPGQGFVSGNTNDFNGCFTVLFDDLDAAGIERIAVRMYLDAKLKGITVRVRGPVESTQLWGTGASPSEGGSNPGGKCGKSPLDPDPNAEGLEWCKPNELLLPINTNNLGVPQPISNNTRYNVAYEQNELSTLMALAQFPVFWFNQNMDMLQFLGGGFNPDEEVVITVTRRNYLVGTGCTSGFPCSAAGWIHAPRDGQGEIEAHIQHEWDRYSKKFIVGHEIGHSLEFIWARFNKNLQNNQALFGDLGYDLDDTNHANECKPEPPAVVSHGISTIEYDAAAANEGFAHFLATDAYNDHTETDAKFNYYKIEDDFGFERDFYLDDQASTREDVCRPNGTVQEDGNVEADWLRFFWAFHRWMVQDALLPSPEDPNQTAQDREKEALSHRMMMLMHAGTILTATGGGVIDSREYYNELAAAICDDGSELIFTIEQLGTSKEVARAVFFSLVEESGVWTGANFSEFC